MRRTLIVGALCALAASAITALASYSSPEGSTSNPWATPQAYAVGYGAPTYQRSARRASKQVIEAKIVTAAARYGVNPTTALRIVKLESGFNPRAVGPRTRHGHAMGLGQLLPSSARALEPGSERHLLDPDVNIRVTMKHIVACKETGARTPDQIAACHVAGPKGWRAKLRRRAERYKRQYVAMFRATRVGSRMRSWSSRGWLARGEASNDVRRVEFASLAFQ